MPSVLSTVGISARFEAGPWLERSAQLYQDLDQIAESVGQDSARRQAETFVVGAVAATLTTGYVVWYLRSFYVLLTALAAQPLWRHFDPLVILKQFEEDDDDVEKMFD